MSKLRAGWRTGQDLPIPLGRPRRADRRAGQVLAEALPRCANVASDFISWASASSSVEWEHGLDPRPVVVGGVNGMRNGKGLLRSVPGEQSELRNVSCCSYDVAAPQGLTLWSLLLRPALLLGRAEPGGHGRGHVRLGHKRQPSPSLGVVPEGCWHKSLGPLLSQTHPSVPRK